MAKTTEEELKFMRDEITRLQSALGESEAARGEAQAHALSMVGPYNGTEEQPTGKTVTVSVCLNPTEKDEKKLKYKNVEYPTYFYRIDLPAGAGLDLTTNGVAYYHGQTYEFDPMTLSDMKSRVARCWEHEKSIHGDQENAYRKPLNKHLVSAAARH